MGNKGRSAALAIVAFAFTISAAPPSRAAEDATSVAAATALFDEAVSLMDRGDYADACPKLLKSQQIAPSGGTLLRLGECYERIGRTASAWLAFREAAARASSAGKKEAESAAVARAARIADSLSRLTVRLEDAAIMQGVTVRRDGVILEPAELGAPTPLDPGTHLVEALAPGHRTWSARVALAASGNVEVTVPSLELVAPGQEDSPAPVRRAPSDSGESQRVVGVLVAGGGLALAGVGTVFGLMASATNDDALSHCDTTVDPRRCDPRGLDLTDQARSQALFSTIFFVAGAAAVVGGAALWLTAPVRVTPSVGRNAAGLEASARW